MVEEDDELHQELLLLLLLLSFFSLQVSNTRTHLQIWLPSVLRFGEEVLYSVWLLHLSFPVVHLLSLSCIPFLSAAHSTCNFIYSTSRLSGLLCCMKTCLSCPRGKGLWKKDDNPLFQDKRRDGSRDKQCQYLIKWYDNTLFLPAECRSCNSFLCSSLIKKVMEQELFFHWIKDKRSAGRKAWIN